MASMSTAMSLSSSVAALAVMLPSNAAFGSSGVQQLAAVRSPVNSNASRVVAARASQSSEEQAPVKSKVLVAAGAAFALNVTPVAPAQAGFFSNDIQALEPRSATTWGTRGSANSGTPFGEGAGGNLVGDNQATRQLSSTGTPLGEGSASGSGVNVAEALKVPDVGLPDVSNSLNKIGELNPLKNGVLDASNIVGDAKNAAQDLAGDAKSKIGMGGMGMPDAGSVASNAKGMAADANVASGAKNSAKDLVGDAKSKLSNVASSDVVGDAKNAAGDAANRATQGVASNTAQDVVENAKNSIGLPNPMEAGKALLSKVSGN
uniref:Uncharacterized protein n=1 Tax=Physcomitrium patens TaxID=3218 RepID=A0A2K1IGS9_PHYPA|nr:hypothetical protein PHYPA_029076 [Physcomitrium patens]